MSKQPCHISDETGSHINDPADVEDARDIEYEVFIPLTANIIITVTADNEKDAIDNAISQYTPDDVHDVEFSFEDIEVEEL